MFRPHATLCPQKEWEKVKRHLVLEKQRGEHWTSWQWKQNNVLTLDFPLNFNTLDLLTAQEMVHTTHKIDSTTNDNICREIFGHDTAEFPYSLFI